jgi:Putative auto-transporter adhesin, head GIN domain
VQPRQLAWKWIDRGLAASLMAAVTMALATAWPGHAHAQRVEGSGESATEQRPLGEVQAVQTHSLKVVVRQGNQPMAMVQADRNLLPLLETVVQDNRHGKTLLVRWKAGTSVKPKVMPVVTVTVVQLALLAVEGSGDMIGEQLKLPRLTGQVSGSGDLRLHDVATDDLTLEVSGSGDVMASGQASRLSVRIAGSGDVKTDQLRADDVKVSIAGSGDASVQAQRKLSVQIAGSGDVR